MKNDFLKKFSEIKLFLFDLEGCILSKNFIQTKETEEELKEKLEYFCKGFKALNTDIGIITSSNSDIVNYLKSIKTCCILNGSLNKVELAEKLLKDRRMTFDDVFFIGDDLLDVPLLQKCKLSASPKDGRREVKRVVTFVTKNESGSVLEEIYEYLKQSKK